MKIYLSNVKKQLSMKFWSMYCRIERSIPELRDISIEVTRGCNLACRHCAVNATCGKGEPEPLSVEAVTEFLTPLGQVKTNNKPLLVGLTGGEPMLYSHIYTLIEKLSRVGFHVRMVSNGTLLDKTRLEKLYESGLRGIAISFDGDEKFTDFLKGRSGTYQKVRQGLEVLQEFRQIPISIISCISSDNIHLLPFIKDVVNSCQASSWRIQPYIPSGRGRDQNEIDISGSDFRALLDFIVLEKAKTNSKTNISFCCSSFLGPEYEQSVRNSYYKCHAGINHLSILSDGSISGCPTLTDKRFVIGSIYTDQVEKLWDEGFQMYRKLDWKKNDFCKGCDWWSNCYGEGMHMWDFSKQRPMACTYRKILQKSDTSK